MGIEKGKNFRSLADQYLANKKYKPFLEAMEYSPLAKIRQITPMDIAVLGDQLSKWDLYAKEGLQISENADGTLSDLGPLPKYAYDVVTAQYAASIVPLICSVQPIPGQQGFVYFKQIQALSTRGNVNSGDILRNALAAPDKQAVGFAGANNDKSVATTVAGNLDYTFPVGTSVRERTLELTVSGITGKMVDDGQGHLYSVGAHIGYGDITYSSGVVNLHLAADPGNGKTVSVTFETDYEASGDLPTTQLQFVSSDVRAEVFATRTEYGQLKTFELRNTFGTDIEQEVISDITSELNAEIGNTLIKRISNAAVGSATWSAAPGTNVSESEHLLAFRFRIAEAAQTIAENAGRGDVSVIVCGTKIAALFEKMEPVFKKTGVASSGPTLWGIWNGRVPVIRSLQTIGASDMYCIYKGSGLFDSSAVYAPYMPLIINGKIPMVNNVLKQQAYAASMAAIKVVIPNFITKVSVTSLP